MFENLIYKHWEPLHCWFSITVPNFAQKCCSTQKLWPKIEIKDGGRLPSCTFWKSELWALYGTPVAADFTSLYKIWRKNVDRRGNYGPKSKSKMAAVRHLWFVTSSYRTTHEVYLLGYIGHSNFMLIRCIVLKIWRFEFFLNLAWNAYSDGLTMGTLRSKLPLIVIVAP